MILFATVIAASIIYHPTPTAKALWDRYEQVGLVFSNRVKDRQDQIEKMNDKLQTSADECVDAFNAEVMKSGGPKELYATDLFVIAKYFEMYADDAAVERFNDKERDIQEKSDKIFKAFDKCLEDVATNKRTAEE